jgi:LysM repeat protein
MTNTSSYLLILLMAPFWVFSQTFYLKYDVNCMNRLEFLTSKETTPFVAYSVYLGNQEMAVFDVGREKNVTVKEIKEKILECKQLLIDKTLVKNINNGTVKLVLVKERPGFFELNPVNQAGFIGHSANTLDVVSPEVEFLLYTDAPVSGQNLAKQGSNYEVYLKSIAPAQCASSFTFELKENLQSSAYQTYSIVPGLGFLEKKSVSGAGFFSDETTNSVNLTTINSLVYRDYLTLFCDRRQAEYYEGRATIQPSVYSDLVTKGAPDTAAIKSDPCSPSKISGIHVVQKGETLYGIARRYGVTLDQLRTWNNLKGTDIIKTCHPLQVAAVAGNPVIPPPAGPPPAWPLVSWASTQDLHIVKPGETVAMLASVYGYTEERFRRMNSLSPKETLLVGQQLRTSDCQCPDKKAAATTDNTSVVGKSAEQPLTIAETDVYFRPILVHVVEKDDTLNSIAVKYNTSPERILELNGMKKGDGIKLNQRLYVQ